MLITKPESRWKRSLESWLDCYVAWDMVKSLEKDEQGQYPNAKITDVVVLEKFKPNNYSLIIGGYIHELNSCRIFMAKVSDFWANYLEAVDMAAIASAQWRGLGKKNDADAAAVEAMRKSFDKVPFDGRVAIGEGEETRLLCYTSEKNLEPWSVLKE